MLRHMYECPVKICETWNWFVVCVTSKPPISNSHLSLESSSSSSFCLLIITWLRIIRFGFTWLPFHHLFVLWAWGIFFKPRHEGLLPLIRKEEDNKSGNFVLFLTYQKFRQRMKSEREAEVIFARFVAVGHFGTGVRTAASSHYNLSIKCNESSAA